MKIIGTAVLLLLSATVTAACSGTSGPLTHGQLVDRANAICRAAGRPYAGDRPSQPAAFLDFLKAQVPAEQNGLKALEGVRPPKAERSAWASQIIAPEREQLADVTAAVAALRDAIGRRDQRMAAALVQQTTSRLDERGAGINAYWKANGMGACLDSPL